MSAAYNKFFINGKWIEPAGRSTLDVINPATEKAFATISLEMRTTSTAQQKSQNQLLIPGLIPVSRKEKESLVTSLRTEIPGKQR